MSIAEKLNQIKAIGFLTDADVAAAAGVAPGTVRFVVRTGEDPRLYRVRERLERFCHVNASARSRSELRFV